VAWADPFGHNPLGSHLVADATGRISAYISRQRDGGSAKALMWSSVNGTWQLANSLPRLTTSARESITTWSDGDMIYNTSVSALQVLVAGTWRGVPLT